MDEADDRVPAASGALDAAPSAADISVLIDAAPTAGVPAEPIDLGPSARADVAGSGSRAATEEGARTPVRGGRFEGELGDDRSSRAPSPGARLGWLRRGAERPDPPRIGIQRLGPDDDDDPIETWPEAPLRAAPVPQGPASQAASASHAPLPPLPARSDFPGAASVAREDTPPPVVRAPLDRPSDPDSAASEHRLLSVLNEVNLADFPLKPQRLRMDPDDALARLSRGDWLELIGRDGEPQDVKVAWINSRRTVVLLVRRPDRRALSLRASELRERFASQRASFIV
jgi:hypothetical protein